MLVGRRRVMAHADHAHFLAIFLAEQRHGAGFHRRFRCHQPRDHLGIFANAGIHLGLHPGEFFGVHGLIVRNIKTQPIRCIQAALLRHMRAKPPA